MRKLVVALVVVTACGGRLETAPVGAGARQEESDAGAGASADTLFPPAGDWATWQLVAIERDGERIGDPPYIELDLHPDGEAFLWTCATGPTGEGERCPFYARVGCLAGTVRLSGTTWHVALQGAKTVAEGDLFEEASGDLRVDGSGALPARGHYRRVAFASPEGCQP